MALNEASPLNIQCTGNLNVCVCVCVCVCKSVNEMDGTCSTAWEDERPIQVFGGET